MRYSLVMPPLVFLCPAVIAAAQVSIGINVPGLSIGINQPSYPDLVPVPGYPVYYLPGSNSNYFFYDGLYWVYQGDQWYYSEWYNGPWSTAYPDEVPLFILRIPVQYYRRPPAYFGGWDRNAPPRWGEHWGPDWERRRHGWDHWDRQAAPAPAPLPVYQRQYGGGRYPGIAQQQQLHGQNYRYEPREAVDRAHHQQRRAQAAATPAARSQGAPQHQPAARPERPNPPIAQPQPMPARPGSPSPPAAQPQPLPARPGSPNPPAAQHSPQARPGNPNPPAWLGSPNPPAAQPSTRGGNPNPAPPHPAPPPPNSPAAQQPRPQQQNHEAPHGNPKEHAP